MFIINKRIQRVPSEVIQQYHEICPSTIGHMTDFGFIKNLFPQLTNPHIVGTAVTVKIPHMDSCAVHKVFDIVQPGDVVCVDMSGDHQRACWGEMVSYMAKAKSVAGAIIDGCVTDIQALHIIGVPVFARKVSPLTTRILGIEGAINIPVSIDGVVVMPGDLIVADGDGVLVLDPDSANRYLQQALNAQQAEIKTKQRIDHGEALSLLSGSAKFFTQEPIQ